MSDFTRFLLGMYVGEPCRICGELLTHEDVMGTTETPASGAVYAGYSKNNDARAAHLACWREYGEQKSAWAYPDDAPDGEGIVGAILPRDGANEKAEANHD